MSSFDEFLRRVDEAQKVAEKALHARIGRLEAQLAGVKAERDALRQIVNETRAAYRLLADGPTNARWDAFERALGVKCT